MTSSFIRYELLTTDPGAAARSYGAVMNWTASDFGQAGKDYRIVTMNGAAWAV